MEILSISFRNFLSLKEDVLDLNNRGLVLLEGENVGNNAFESNGAGKSILPDALCWVLYGSTIRGLKGDEVVNWTEGKDCSVTLLLTDNGDEYEIARFRKHRIHKNDLVILKNGNDVSKSGIHHGEQFVEQLIGMNYTTFTNSVLFGQNVKEYFASYTDSQKKKVLEQLLEVTVYERALEEVKTIVKGLTNSRSSKLAELLTGQDRLVIERERLEDHKEARRSLREAVAERVEGIRKRIRTLESRNETLDKDLGRINKKIRMLKKKKPPFDSNKYSELQKHWKSVSKSLDSFEGELNAEKRALKKLVNERENAENEVAEGSSCPVCLRKVTSKDKRHVISEYDTLVVEKEKVISEIKVKMDNADKVLLATEKILQTYEEQLEQIEKFEEDLRELQHERDNCKAHVEGNLSQIEELEEEIETIEEDSGSKSKLIKTKARIVKLKKEETKLREELKGFDELLSMYRYWEIGFGNKGIKSLLFDSVIPMLNEYVGEYISILSDDTITITFSSYKKLKSKDGIKEEFDIDIKNKNGSRTYKGNSGGERRRIDLAILLAFRKLSVNRSSKRLNLVLFDEVFENLDKIGSQKTVELLKKEYSNEGTCIVITHNKELKSFFPSSIKIQKVKGVSSYLE